jgi:hypothetical protein
MDMLSCSFLRLLSVLCLVVLIMLRAAAILRRLAVLLVSSFLTRGEVCYSGEWEVHVAPMVTQLLVPMPRKHQLLH